MVELQATVGRLIQRAARTPLEIVAESLSQQVTSLEMTLKAGREPSEQTLTNVMRPARDLVALLAGERGPQPADFGIDDADPDLALAKRCDSECNRGIRVVADQRLAEKHYLAHIARTADSAAKARAWVQIGTVYSTNDHADKGEKPDFEKARRCFTEALQLEPRRFGHATVKARTMEVGPDLPAEERLRIRVRTVKWLMGIDEPALRRDWLPAEGRDQPTDRDIRAFLEFVANVRSAEENNLVGDASSTPDPAGSLRWLIAELPGSAAADAAPRRLDKLAK